MNIEVNDSVKKWIASKGKHLTIEAVSMNACCGGFEEFMTTPKRPKKLEYFKEFKVDHLSIYIHNNILLKDNIKLELSGFGFFKSVSAKSSML